MRGKAQPVYPFYGSRLLKGYEVRQACRMFRGQEQESNRQIADMKKTARSTEQTA